MIAPDALRALRDKVSNHLAFHQLPFDTWDLLDELRDVLAALLDADPPAETPQQWQPIESAPKNGTYLLLRGDSWYINRPYRVHVGRWVADAGRDGGWWEQSEDAYLTLDGDRPTHWMPLPPVAAARLPQGKGE